MISASISDHGPITAGEETAGQRLHGLAAQRNQSRTNHANHESDVFAGQRLHASGHANHGDPVTFSRPPLGKGGNVMGDRNKSINEEASARPQTTCKYCNGGIVWLSTPHGYKPFDIETRPSTEVPDGDGYLLRRSGLAVPTMDVPPRVLANNPRVAVHHRCQQYRDWKVQQTYGLAAGIDNVKQALTEGIQQ